MLVDEYVLTQRDEPYDVIIVGAGAAGLTLAHALDLKGHKILVVEAGDARETRQGRQDCAGEVATGSSHPALDLYRVRALGGTSRIWGGRCIPLDNIDFEQRDWVEHSGWPIEFADLEHYYAAALSEAEAGRNCFDPSRTLAGQQAELARGLDGPIIRTTLERFSRPTNFWTRLGRILERSSDVRVLANANVVRIRLEDGARNVASLELVGRSGRSYSARARFYVLAAGGLETTRLLLASNDVKRSGLGNEADHLGRYYMTHLCTTAGAVTFSLAKDRIAFDYARDADGVYIRRRLWFTEAAQRENELLNTTFRTHYSDPSDPRHQNGVLSAMFLAKGVVQREYAAKFCEAPVAATDYLRHVGNIVTQLGAVGRFGRKWLRDRTFADRKLPSVVLPSKENCFVLEFHAEQAPNPLSRISLAHSRDRFGAPRLHIDWRLADIDIASLKRAHILLGRTLKTTGIGQLKVDLDELEDRARNFGIVGGHHIGTTRMSHDEKTGVVDRNCRVHGTNNLFVASSSVLPTSGQANPTLTILALTLRLADHLERAFQQERIVSTAAPPARGPAKLEAMAASFLPVGGLPMTGPRIALPFWRSGSGR